MTNSFRFLKTLDNKKYYKTLHLFLQNKSPITHFKVVANSKRSFRNRTSICRHHFISVQNGVVSMFSIESWKAKSRLRCGKAVLKKKVTFLGPELNFRGQQVHINAGSVSSPSPGTVEGCSLQKTRRLDT